MSKGAAMWGNRVEKGTWVGDNRVPSGWLKDYGESLDMLVLMSDLTFLANEMFPDKSCCSDSFCSHFFLI